MSPYEQFKQENAAEIARQSDNVELKRATAKWMNLAQTARYSYHFEWLGRPVIQYPQDIVAMQELIWTLRPDAIVETGIAHGGSLILYASLLAMLDMADALGEGKAPAVPSERLVVGVDIDIRAHNRQAIEEHPFSPYIRMIQGSSIDDGIVDQVKAMVSGKKRVLVVLDSNHTHEHVLRELELYAPLVTAGSYCVVFDTVVEDLTEVAFDDRPWGPGDNPKTAVWKFLEDHADFEIDREMHTKLLITVAPDGFLRRKG